MSMVLVTSVRFKEYDQEQVKLLTLKQTPLPISSDLQESTIERIQKFILLPHMQNLLKQNLCAQGRFAQTVTLHLDGATNRFSVTDSSCREIPLLTIDTSPNDPPAPLQSDENTLLRASVRVKLDYSTPAEEGWDVIQYPEYSPTVREVLKEIENLYHASLLKPRVDSPPLIERLHFLLSSRLLPHAKILGPTDFRVKSSKLIPIGISNNGNDCWLISLMQMIWHTPSLTEMYKVIANRYYNDVLNMQNHNVGALLIEAYNYFQSAKDNAAFYSDCAGLLRESFAYLSRSPRTPLDQQGTLSSKDQQDVHEAFLLFVGLYETILENQPSPYLIRSTYKNFYIPVEGKKKKPFVGKDPTRPIAVPGSAYYATTSVAARGYPLVTLYLKRGQSFAKLLDSYFISHEHVEIDCALSTENQLTPCYLTSSHLSYEKVPCEIVVHVARFNGFTLQGSSKNSSSLADVPFQFELPLGSTPGDETPLFELDSFIVHLGEESISRGHYVSYQKIGDQWYYCNDKAVQPVEVDSVKEAVQLSYLLHYTAISD